MQKTTHEADVVVGLRDEHKVLIAIVKRLDLRLISRTVRGLLNHFVDAGTDSGPIIVQKCVPVLEDDTPESLHARIQVQEHIAYPEALRIIAEGKYRIEGRRVRL